VSLKFCILSSGSAGNCSVIWTEESAVLIDCGCNAKYITENLADLGIALKNLKAAFITHAHADHISASGLGFLSRNSIPVCACENVFEDLFRKYGDKAKECVKTPFYENFKIKDISVEYFDIYHRDKNISCACGFAFLYTTNTRQYKIGYLTDTGRVCGKIIRNLANSNILVIESNYNRMMLESSLRPPDNKKWILSDWGHLSNEDAANSIAEIKTLSTVKDSLKYVFLAHISASHNTPEIALKTTKETLLSRGISNIKLFTAGRKRRGPTINITEAIL